ncbi:MAG: OmpA family protein [Oligoflexia bacterium]|nr:OmpA family protein [Oligoflexia bacterium]
MADEKPIIIIKKKGGHGGHHGGAWKIAYADFVTAMMCFFLVMWLVNSADVTTKQNIASYFRRPGIFSEGSGTPLLLGGAGILEDAYAPIKPKDSTGTGRKEGVSPLATVAPTPAVRTPEDQKKETPAPQNQVKLTPEQENALTKAALEKAIEQKNLQGLADQIKKEIAGSPELAKLLGIVNVKLAADGLLIDIMDTEKESMFNSGSAAILPGAYEAFATLARMMEKVPNKIEIVGHTDAKPFSARPGGYSNWELSADRANAARKILEQNGIPPERIESVIGRADKELRLEDKPFDPSNRRITLKMSFNITKRIDLAKDPTILENLDKITPEPIIPAETGSDGVPMELPTAVPTAVPKQKALGYTPKKIVKAAKQEENKISIADPDEAPSPGAAPKGSAAGESPVLGPPDQFGGF